MIQVGTRIPINHASGHSLVVSEMTEDQAHAFGLTFSQISPWSTYSYAPDTLTKYFSQKEPGAPRFAIHHDRHANEAVGVVGLRENWLRGPLVQFLGLVPQHQGHGYGSALLRHILTDAQHGGFENAWIMVSEFNTHALALYQRLGFKPAANIADLVKPNSTEILLRYRLSS